MSERSCIGLLSTKSCRYADLLPAIVVNTHQSASYDSVTAKLATSAIMVTKTYFVMIRGNKKALLPIVLGMNFSFFAQKF